MKVRFRHLAENELADAVAVYETQRPNRGVRFARAVRIIREEIAENPLRYPEIQDGVREAGLKDFPYAIYYIVFETCIDVIAVHHTSRDPESWQRRVR